MTSNQQNETKICCYCAESIPAAAKLCPRCRQWLKLLSFRNPIVFFVVGFVPAFAALGIFIYFAGNLMNPRPYYSDFKGSIQILESNMYWVQTTDTPYLFVTGILTNQSQVAWKDPEFECRFFNSKGQLVDAANNRILLTALPGADSAFRVAVRPPLSSNNYSSFKISVSNARNVRSPF